MGEGIEFELNREKGTSMNETVDCN